jgi:prepilin-type N-terminal cleavage/methylation domain-containing protein
MNHPRPAGPAGFTLSEVLVTMGISTVVLGACLSFFITSLNIFHYDIGKNLVNKDIRSFTSELTDSATYANYFLIYPNFTTRTATVAGATVSADVEDKQTGDMLVLVFKDPTNVDLVTRVVGYYRAPSDANDRSSTGPVRKFDRIISPPSSAAIHTLLPSSTMSAAKVS